MERRVEPLVDPAFFLHRMDVAANRAVFVRTERDALRSASFLDGRTRFWTGDPVKRPLDLLLEARGNLRLDARFIFHTGFCGSTFLARLIDRPAKVLVLREPQALTDLAAAWQAVPAGSRQNDAPLNAPLNLAQHLLGRRWEATEAVVIKPSSWINNIVRRLCADQSIKPVFVTAPRRDFMRAILRGGSDRLAFAARTVVHLSGSGPGAEWVAAALARPVETIDKLTTLAALLDRVQRDIFAEAQTEGGWGPANRLSSQDIRQNVGAAVSKAEVALAVGHQSPTAAWDTRHAKQPDALFSWARQDEIDASVEARYGLNIDQACRWVDQTLPPGPDISR